MALDKERPDVDRQSTAAIVLGLALSVSIGAGLASGGAPLVASVAGFTDDGGAVPVDISDDNSSDPQPMTEFSWGTVTHETDPETGETNVEVTVEDADDVSISVTPAPDPTDGQEPADADPATEMETFPWGAVTHAADPETGETDVEVTIETEDDVSVSVTTVSDAGSQSASTVVTSTGDATATANVTQTSDSNSTSTTTVSQSTNVSSGASIDIDDGTGDD